MEHNQCRSLSILRSLGSAQSVLFFGRCGSTSLTPISFVAFSRFATSIVNKPVQDSPVKPCSLGSTSLHRARAVLQAIKSVEWE